MLEYAHAKTDPTAHWAHPCPDRQVRQPEPSPRAGRGRRLHPDVAGPDRGEDQSNGQPTRAGRVDRHQGRHAHPSPQRDGGRRPAHPPPRPGQPPSPRGRTDRRRPTSLRPPGRRRPVLRQAPPRRLHRSRNRRTRAAPKPPTNQRHSKDDAVTVTWWRQPEQAGQPHTWRHALCPARKELVTTAIREQRIPKKHGQPTGQPTRLVTALAPRPSGARRRATRSGHAPSM